MAVSQDDPDKLVMLARADNADAMTATSSDGGLTWTSFTAATSLPSHNVARSYFGKDSNGQYLYLYTTCTSTETRPALNYETKRPGAAWSGAKFFADGPSAELDPTPAGTGEGWDTYPMADEYAPGRFFVVWEFDTSRIKVNKLDISDAP
ncbi:hypothetical protein GR925_04550 [Streptomyces sp. HUCO-GS316]|nr:hypothetical protein [Streptomyces sp. HUCO-GS316]